MLTISGMGYAYPENRITNQFLEELGIESSGEWILAKIGIKERRTSLPLDYIKSTKNQDPEEGLRVMETTPTKLGVEAAKMAIERAGIDVQDIGRVITNCCTPMETCPSEAQRIACELGLQVPAFDMFTACPAFALHIDYLNNHKEEKLPEHTLCISTATLTQRVNYTDRSDSAIWGDGAAAWVVSKGDRGKLQIVDTSFHADPKRCHAVVIDTYKHFRQDGRAVRDFSVRQTVRMIKEHEKSGLIDWNRDIFVGHQANATMLEQIRNNRGIPHENHWHNVTFIGNQAGAGAPAAIAENWEKIESGQNIVVAVVGAGLSWGSALLKAL